MKKLLTKVLALTLCTCTTVGLATSAMAAENQVTQVPMLSRTSN